MVKRDEAEKMVGKTYTIIENDKRLTGKIIQVNANNEFVVIWLDGLETVEDEVDPMCYVRNS